MRGRGESNKLNRKSIRKPAKEERLGDGNRDHMIVRPGTFPAD